MMWPGPDLIFDLDLSWEPSWKREEYLSRQLVLLMDEEGTSFIAVGKASEALENVRLKVGEGIVVGGETWRARSCLT
jgi:hypothetical protein